ncbi:NAD(P)/FAD-dependent oxidoreductase [Streptomyces sp. G45]|uniref:NAD(P)/FAD-dependent oxidoreductase n=1 Tax=Streptomyces sp. G45 TaxID=3406627 RepID=UPI003C254A72
MTTTTTPPRVTIVGAGLAGARLAARLGSGATLIGDEPHPPYNRVLLTDVLAGRYAPEVIALPPPPGAYHRARAVEIDRAARVVRCADGTRVPYETLVLATGANPVLPPLRGLFAPGAAEELPRAVHAFRTMDDCLALARAARPGTRAVVIGGGLLGVCAARALADRGARVVLAQQGDRLMERQLDPAAAELVRLHLTGLGVEVHTECRVTGVRQADGAVRAVHLADGYVLAAELTVLACGVRPRTGLARAAGLDVRRGVVVDDQLRTSDPRIRAIGDCAEHAGTTACLAAPALDQADALAAALLPRGPAPPYTGTRSLTRLTLPHAHHPLDVAAFGEAEARPDDDVIRLADATRGTYRKVVVRGDRIVGGVLLGELAAVGALARAWESDEPLPADGAPPLHLLTHDGGH